MPGLRGPSDYSQEPPRHPSLKINAKQPFNAEPHRAALVSSYITPVDFFYKRNHGPIPIVDDIERYHVSVGGMVEKPIQLSMSEIKKLPKYTVTATLQCAGNRRTAMSKTRTVRGVGWDVSALGNATWGGAKLSDVLELVGISKLSSVSSLGGKHVEFTSVDKCKVFDFYKRPNSECSPAKSSGDELSHMMDNPGIQLLGQIRHGSCRPRAILFKFLADSVGLESKLVVGLSSDGSIGYADSYKHISVVVVLDSVELLVDLMRFPGQFFPFSTKAIFMSHTTTAGESDSAENDSCDSPLELNSPLCGFSDKIDDGKRRRKLKRRLE